MTDCTRCNGSGKEPDRVEAAHVALIEAIEDHPGPIVMLRQLANELMMAHLADAQEREGTLTFTRAALRDILSRFHVPSQMQGTHQILQVPNEDLANWRKILGDEPVTEDVYRDGAYVMTRPKVTDQ